MEQLIDILDKYVLSLDWVYIITLILISALLTNDNSLKKFGIKTPNWMLNIPKGWRVVTVGCVYGAFLYWLRDYHKQDVERMLQSLVFTLVFHQLIIKVAIDRFMNWLTITPKNE